MTSCADKAIFRHRVSHFLPTIVGSGLVMTDVETLKHWCDRVIVRRDEAVQADRFA
jgi:predicted TIM-barrel enzyme